MKKLFTSIVVFAAVTLNVQAQTFSVNNEKSTLTVEGTSTLHDWEIVVEQMSGSTTITDADGVLTLISLNFYIKVESLKSGEGKMDNNTYKALKSDDYPFIKYEVTKATVTQKSGSNFTMSMQGILSIAGTSKEIIIPVTTTRQKDGIAFSGSKSLKMTEFNIAPPTALMGTIKTGDEITVKFNIQYKVIN